MGKILPDMRKLVFVAILLYAYPLKAQLYINPGVDTLDTDVKTAIGFYQKYLNEFPKVRLPDFKEYWPAKDLIKYKVPDPIVYGISGDYPTYKFQYKPTIFYIKPAKEFIHIKTQFSSIDSLKNISTLCITNHYIGFDPKGKPFFVSPVEINAKNWKTTKVRNLTYRYPSYHNFNQKRADSLIRQIINLEKIWELKPIDITYYFANTFEEIQNLRGFDFTIGLGNRDKPTGISDDRDDIIYSAGNGENHFHEVVHIYLNRHFPKSPLLEGLAVFYGGSLGKDLSWHLKRLNTYLIQHPEINLNQLEDFWRLDNYTNPGTAIEGMLCNMAFKKAGLAGLKKILSHPNMDEVFKEEFGLTKNELNTWLRKTIAEQAIATTIGR